MSLNLSPFDIWVLMQSSLKLLCVWNCSFQFSGLDVLTCLQSETNEHRPNASSQWKYSAHDGKLLKSLMLHGKLYEHTQSLICFADGCRMLQDLHGSCKCSDLNSGILLILLAPNIFSRLEDFQSVFFQSWWNLKAAGWPEKRRKKKYQEVTVSLDADAKGTSVDAAVAVLSELGGIVTLKEEQITALRVCLWQTTHLLCHIIARVELNCSG